MADTGSSVKKGRRLAAVIISVLLIIIGAAIIAGRRFLPSIDPAEVEDPALLFELAIPLEDVIRPPDTPPGYPVLVTGELAVQNKARDYFALKHGSFLGLRRQVESYAWFEKKIPLSDEGKTGTKEEYRFEYGTEWTGNPAKWKTFRIWKGHRYNFPPIEEKEFIADGASIGRLVINLDVAELMGWKDYIIDKTLDPYFKIPHDKRYIYNSHEALDKPIAGDFRFFYRVVEFDPDKPQITVLGARDFNRLIPFTTGQGRKLLLVRPGPPHQMKAALGEPPLSAAKIRLLHKASLGLGGLLAGLGVLIILWLALRRPGKG